MEQTTTMTVFYELNSHMLKQMSKYATHARLDSDYTNNRDVLSREYAAVKNCSE